MVAEEALIDDDFEDGEIVEWYARRPVTVSTAVATGSIVAAFAIGVLTGVGALVLLDRLDD